MHGKLFGQLRSGVYTPLKSDSTLDLLSASDSYLGFLMNEQDQKLANRNEFLGISGEAGDVLGDLFTAGTDAAEYMLAPETGGGSVFAGTITGDLFTVGGDSIGLASGATGVGESPDKVAPTLVTVGNLFTFIQSSYGYAAARMNEVEGLITSDPTKLADAAAQVSGGEWDLEQQVNNEHQAFEVITFQQRVAALQYMLPRMISAVATPCDVGGSADDPTTYEAWTQFIDYGTGNFLGFGSNRLRSVHLTSSDAQTLASHLFEPPFSPGTDPIAAGPTSAALARSPFFMWQIAPTTSSTSGPCTENFE